ncbi:MAG: hypothetical protein V8R75_01850 [Oscillospiraceae bacterium]
MVTLPVDDAEKLQYFLLQEFEDHGETVMHAPGEGFYATPGKGRSEIRIAYVTAAKTAPGCKGAGPRHSSL